MVAILINEGVLMLPSVVAFLFSLFRIIYSVKVEHRERYGLLLWEDCQLMWVTCVLQPIKAGTGELLSLFNLADQFIADLCVLVTVCLSK